MKIEYFGHSCFLITTGTGVTVLTDPYTNVGYELPAGLRADVVTVSHEHFDHNHVASLEYAGTIVKGEGVRTEHGIRFIGITTFHDPEQGRLRGKNTVYKIEADGITLCHMGDIGEPYTQALAEKIGKVEVLFLPVGGNYTIDAVEAKRYVEGFCPQTVILMHYRPQDGKIDIETEQPFLALMETYREYDGEYRTEENTRIVFIRRKDKVSV